MEHSTIHHPHDPPMDFHACCRGCTLHLNTKHTKLPRETDEKPEKSPRHVLKHGFTEATHLFMYFLLQKVIARNRRHWKCWDLFIGNLAKLFATCRFECVMCTPENVPPRCGDAPARPERKHFRRSSIQVLSSRPRVCSCNFI